MTVCPNCGEYIIEEGNFCTNCGWIREGTAVPPHLRPQKKRESLSIEQWILLCLCLTPFGALIYFILTRTE